MVKVYYENLTDKEIPNTILEAMRKVINYTVMREYPKYKFEVSLTLCDNEYIKELNREHRNIDNPTDVLSFPFFDFSTPDVTTMLGDIVISVEKALEQAAEYGHSFKRELCFLSVHSALHLLGYDHEDEESAKVMEALQKEILEKHKILR